MWWGAAILVAIVYAAHKLGIARWTTTATAIAILYAFSKSTGIQMGKVVEAAFGLFVIIGGPSKTAASR